MNSSATTVPTAQKNVVLYVDDDDGWTARSGRTFGVVAKERIGGGIRSLL